MSKTQKQVLLHISHPRMTTCYLQTWLLQNQLLISTNEKKECSTHTERAIVDVSAAHELKRKFDTTWCIHVHREIVEVLAPPTCGLVHRPIYGIRRLYVSLPPPVQNIHDQFITLYVIERVWWFMCHCFYYKSSKRYTFEAWLGSYELKNENKERKTIRM